ncbi:hypothetical protein S40285_01634 [Stachybotrys chlorohalonatus IBT 40285]|uniref:Amino acid permease/ SLC12A domain-containing protein n=1 Tax=Stachybotrys chlorohalonatus (strain IBT 40285) TaxID=1283841 RepID=A0A084QDU2_STAC4|nr:hypothetical protein S40285_01634 [Stachybotrys chlorohalonata IBT 40285]
MSSSPGAQKPPVAASPESRKAISKLGTVSGVYIPVYLNILSILMFLRFGRILGQVGLVGMLALIVTAYSVDLLTALSLSAIASNGEVKGGGAYFLISRSLGPEFGGSIGILFFLAQVLNTAMNIVGLIDCIRHPLDHLIPHGYWITYGLQSVALLLCTGLCLLGSATFSKASNGLLIILTLSILTIPISAVFNEPFYNEAKGVEFTAVSWKTLSHNLLPNTGSTSYQGFETFRELFGVLFPATSGIFAGASMSGDLRNPSKAIPKGTLWAMLTTFIVYVTVVLSMAASTTRESLVRNTNILSLTNLSATIILAGECAVTMFSALMGILGSAKLFQALAQDKLLPGLTFFGKGTVHSNEPLAAIFLTYLLAQISLLADLDQIATLISMGYQMTFFVMNLACFLLKIGSAPNFRPSFKFFTWQTAGLGALLSAAAMFFIDETYASIAISILVFLFLLIHYLSPPKHWGDVSQNLIYHQVRKYLLRLKPEHIKFWRPQIILLINNPRRQTRLIQFCNSLKKGSLYILGHVIITDNFDTSVDEARLQQQAWTRYISEYSRIKAFVQLAMSPSLNWGVRNLILSAGLGGMRPNIAVMGFYNMQELRNSKSGAWVPDIPAPPAAKMKRPQNPKSRPVNRARSDTSSRLLAGFLPTDVIRTESMMSPTQYMTILEDLALKYRLNVAVGYGFERLESPWNDEQNHKRYIDLWPIQMSAEVTTEGKNVLTTNFDTYTLILQLGHILRSVRTWRRTCTLRVMVFVEYETEVEEERARVKALLEKLRIDAEIVVFWLASGVLNSYELIINGKRNDIDWEIVVNEALGDEEWWEDIQMLRGNSQHLSPAEELQHIVQIIDSTAERPGSFNPHEEAKATRRRRSTVDMSEVPKKPAITILGQMGVNVGIHTHHLNDDVLQESSSDIDSESSEEESDIDGGMTYRSFGKRVLGGFEPVRRPLLASRDLSTRAIYGRDESESSSNGRRSFYGTMATPQLQRQGQSFFNEPFEHPRTKQDDPPLGSRSAQQSRAISPTQEDKDEVPEDTYAGPTRPSTSGQISTARSSSRPALHTSITTDCVEPKIGFLGETSKSERPSFSRHSSLGRFSSRPVPETQVHVHDDQPRTISFADTPVYSRSPAHSRHHSRQGSGKSGLGPSESRLSIPELVEAYKEDAFAARRPESGGSAYSTQGFSLSFNDLPSRAQHLILNELMKQNSAETAVMLTTLPIPSEGTCQDEISSIQYLSDVEVLCNDLPPALMVLSNNMTVTVSL